MSEILLYKEYKGESIVDIEQDVYECINVSDLPVDEYGFATGTFTVKIEWEAINE